VPRVRHRFRAIQPAGPRIFDWANQALRRLTARRLPTNLAPIPGRKFPAQLDLAWVLAQGGDIVPIPGTKRRRYVQENIGALDVNLSTEDLARIDEVAPHEVVAGARYPDWAMQMVNR